MSAVITGSDTKVRSGDSRTFYARMAAVCAFIAIAGYLPTYWLPLAAGRFDNDPVVHIHGAVFFAWTIFNVWQANSAAHGRMRRHRAGALLGVSLATLMVILGMLIVLNVFRKTAADGALDFIIPLMLASVSDIAVFATLFVSALVAASRAELHQRLMLLATISILGAPLTRAVLAVYTWQLYPSLAQVTPAVGTTAMVLADMLIVVCLVHDWRRSGRLHAGFVVAACAVVAVHVLRAPFASTQMWHSMAMALNSLRG